jgi:hypothetical protein
MLSWMPSQRRQLYSRTRRLFQYRILVFFKRYTILMDTVEYERRRLFCEEIKRMKRHEQIEIARILQNNDIHFSENNNGILFDLVTLPQSVFDELVKFNEFVKTSIQVLEQREHEQEQEQQKQKQC